MKMRTQRNIYTLAMLVLMCILQGCGKTEISEKKGFITTGDANFVATNLTTGESAKNKGELDNPDRLIVHSGDIIELSYIPKQENEQYDWEVTFDLAGENISADDSYTTQYTIADLTPGKYTITCTSEMREDINEEEFWGLREIGYVYIEILSK